MHALYSKYRFRLIHVKTSNGGKYNWLFLPGGPGLGSEYFQPLLSSIILPGTIWRLDFPGDGSNIVTYPLDYKKDWTNGLLDIIQCLPHVILVTHSFSSMFALTVPELDLYLSGLVLMNGAPHRQWSTGIGERIAKFDLSDASSVKSAYEKEKNNTTFKKFTLNSWPYFMSEQVKSKAFTLLDSLPYNYRPYKWAQTYFHPEFQAKWIPTIPTLIIGGELDLLTPIQLFYDDERFYKENIVMVEIKKASHFPWMEQPRLIEEQLVRFYQNVE
jgi:pimeloyl-ACP methyl ester carboxylesterase